MPLAARPFRSVPVATVDSLPGQVVLRLDTPGAGFRCSPQLARELAALLERAAREAEAPRLRPTRAPLPGRG